MISYKSNYYIPIDENNNDVIFYKGTKVEAWEDIFTKELRIYKNKKIYKTRQLEGRNKDQERKEQIKIENQKILEQVIRERDERIKARASKASSF